MYGYTSTACRTMAQTTARDDPKVRDVVSTMLKAGQSQRAIAAALKMRRSRVAEIIRQIRGNELTQEPQKNKAGTTVPSENHDTESQSNEPAKASKKPAKEMTEARTVSRYTQKGSEYLSDMLLSDLKLSMETAKAIRKLELQYRPSVEKYGIDWVDFLNGAIEWGFQSIVEADAMYQEWQARQRERLILEQEASKTLEWVIAAHKARREVSGR